MTIYERFQILRKRDGSYVVEGHTGEEWEYIQHFSSIESAIRNLQDHIDRATTEETLDVDIIDGIVCIKKNARQNV